MSHRLNCQLPGLILLTLALASASHSHADDLSAEESKAGFKSLFNGKDFTGWRFVGGKEPTNEAPNWEVKEGVIHLTGGGNPHLSTDREYGDFEMRFQWRAVQQKKGYNSGFFIRSGPRLGSNQINLAKGAEGKLMAGKLAGGDAAPQLQKPAGEWNDWRVVVRGDQVTFWCNGTQAWSVTGLTPAKGYIGLQAEGAEMEYRQLRLRELTPADKVDP